MPRDTRNIGASVRAILLARSRAESTDFQILLTRYALERLLYRLSISEHRERFILKGALPLVTWVANPFRPTRDLDLLGHGPNNPEAVAETFKAICSIDVPDDGVVFNIDGLTAASIREDLVYGGLRVQTVAVIDGARIPIQIDIGFGDIITPEPIEIDYPVLLEFPAPHIRGYPVETVVAEKFNAMVVLGIANSRLKDYYDLWLISRTFEFDHAVSSRQCGEPLNGGKLPYQTSCQQVSQINMRNSGTDAGMLTSTANICTPHQAVLVY